MKKVCLEGMNVEVYLDRICDALKRRHYAVSLCKYFTCIQNMPVNERITSTMTHKQFERIYYRAASMDKLLSLNAEVANNEIDEAKRLSYIKFKSMISLIVNQLLHSAENLRSL